MAITKRMIHRVMKEAVVDTYRDGIYYRYIFHDTKDGPIDIRRNYYDAWDTPEGNRPRSESNRYGYEVMYTFKKWDGHQPLVCHVKKAREEAGISIDELAKKANRISSARGSAVSFSVEDIDAIETLNIIPNYTEAELIASAMDTTVDLLWEIKH